MMKSVSIKALDKSQSINGLNKFARKLLFSVLENIQFGSITITDTQTYQFGSESSDQELHVELRILDPNAYRNILFGGSLGAAESYVEQQWISDDLVSLIRLLSMNMRLIQQLDSGLGKLAQPISRFIHWLNKNTKSGSEKNIQAHYDIGNDLFKLFLDQSLMYSSAIFPSHAATLEEASINKLAVICDKLQLSANDHLLEIGTGWGSLAIYAAKHYGCRITTTTISKEQYALAEERITQEGLTHLIDLRLEDYRDLQGKFDKLVSVEMIEAVGHHYHPTFFAACSRLLKDDGIMVLQAITIEDQRYDSARKEVDFIKKYIFPGCCIPSLHRITTCMRDCTDMKLVQLEDITTHYARTLAEWRRRFLLQRQEVLALGYDENFIRLWDFYFAYCEGGFAERIINDVQIVFSKPMSRHQFNYND